MLQIDSTNTLFTLATDLVNLTSRHIFLTGKAGTGKTTFLKYIRENCSKQMVVVAPTGVAAINANGVTIHSFFQLPFSPFIPEAKGFSESNSEISNRHTLLSRLRFTSERRKIIQELELLVIDEISMVRCDVLDSIDLVLRHIRHKHYERFGGVQLLFIGDMFQLPPVVKEQEWGLLKEHYNSPYFFDSMVMKEEPPVYVEFTKIYRQTEEKFIRLLNQVRNNDMDQRGVEILEERYKPTFFGEQSDEYILLTTHNEKARSINASELSKLAGKLFTYKATIEQEFPANAYPADELLQLKVGAQVMFIKNDTDKSKRYFNGKIGVITELTDDKITVQCKDDSATIEVKKEKWDNIRYTLNKSTRHLEEDVVGSFSQYPLRLAWAITIHKSQGLTFEKAVIDAGEAFAPGQVYVALSRCTNLQGMVLHTRIRSNSFHTDSRIVHFTQTNLGVDFLVQELLNSKKVYQERVLMSLFDFTKPIAELRDIQKYLVEHLTSFNAEAFTWSEDLMAELATIQATAQKFHNQLKRLFQQTERAEENTGLQDRIKAAAVFFSNQLVLLMARVLQSPSITDSRMQAKEYNELLNEVYMQLSQQNYLLQGFGGKFDMQSFHRRKRSFVAPSFSVNAYAGVSDKKMELAHPVLYFQLKKLRDSICSKKNLPIYIVAGSKCLEEMARFLPLTTEELLQISGFGKAKVEVYGNQFLSIIQEYCKENNLQSNIGEKSPKRQRKESKGLKNTDTKSETFRLYKEGNSVSQITSLRNLTAGTIESHLAYFVETGQIKIEELVSREKIVLIEPALKVFDGGSITPIKEKLGSQVSFGEIRLVLAWKEHQKNSPSHKDH